MLLHLHQCVTPYTRGRKDRHLQRDMGMRKPHLAGSRRQATSSLEDYWKRRAADVGQRDHTLASPIFTDV